MRETLGFVRLSAADLRRIGQITLAVTAFVGIVGGIYYVWYQATRTVTSLEFRPTFQSARQGKYPNDLPFSTADVVAPSIIDSVFDVNGIKDYCPREVFRTGFFVEQRSDESVALDAEYATRLAEVRLPTVDRERLLAEYQAKRQALPLNYRLTYVRPPACNAVPLALISKVMHDILNTWATESERTRGVLNLQIEVLTPGMLDVGLGQEASPLLRADLVRTSLVRIVDNIQRVEQLPGATLVRFGEQRLAFMEVRNKLSDLLRSRLEPLVVLAGQALGRESAVWLAETLSGAEREHAAALGRSQAHQAALREYSGVPQSLQGERALAPATTPDGPGMVPQLDRSFIDRLIEMSETNTRFRQTLTEAMVRANVEAVEAERRASYYRRLLSAVGEAGPTSLTPADLDSRLTEIVNEGKKLTQQFNDLYEAFSKIALRPAAAMYQTDRPVTQETHRGFSGAEWLIITLLAAIISALLASAAFLLRDRFGRRLGAA